MCESISYPLILNIATRKQHTMLYMNASTQLVSNMEQLSCKSKNKLIH